MRERELIDEYIEDMLGERGYEAIPRPYGTWRGGKVCDIFAFKDSLLYRIEVKYLKNVGDASYECDRAIGQCLRYHKMIDKEWVKRNLWSDFDEEIASDVVLIIAYRGEVFNPYIRDLEEIIEIYNLPTRVELFSDFEEGKKLAVGKIDLVFEVEEYLKKRGYSVHNKWESRKSREEELEEKLKNISVIDWVNDSREELYRKVREKVFREILYFSPDLYAEKGEEVLIIGVADTYPSAFLRVVNWLEDMDTYKVHPEWENKSVKIVVVTHGNIHNCSNTKKKRNF